MRSLTRSEMDSFVSQNLYLSCGAVHAGTSGLGAGGGAGGAVGLKLQGQSAPWQCGHDAAPGHMLGCWLGTQVGPG